MSENDAKVMDLDVAPAEAAVVAERIAHSLWEVRIVEPNTQREPPRPRPVKTGQGERHIIDLVASSMDLSRYIVILDRLQVLVVALPPDDMASPWWFCDLAPFASLR